jgi:predicted nucleotidyltransferase
MDPLQAIAALSSRHHRLMARSTSYPASVTDLPDKLGAIHAAARIFEAHGVPYALIGGVAVGIRSGVPRATLDVDFAISTQVDRRWMVTAFASEGFRPRGEFAHSLNFSHTSGEPVQLAFDAGFDAMIARAELMELGDQKLRVVTKDDLIAMKRRAATDPMRRRSKALRDQADIALLEGDVPDADEGW